MVRTLSMQQNLYTKTTECNSRTFEEISIFSNGGHLGWRAWLSDICFKGNPLRMIQDKFGLNWPNGFRREDF